MKKLFRKLALPVAAILMFVVGVESASASTMEDIVSRGELRVAVQTQGPPISFIDKNNERTGLAVEIVKAMAKDMGVKVVFKDYDWKGLIPALLAGKVDFVAADMTPTAKRATQLLFTEPAFFTANVAFTTKDTMKEKGFKSWKDLNDSAISVGATQASTYAAAAKQYLPKADLKEYSGGSAATAQALAQGRVDAAISDTGTLKGLMKKYSDFVVLDGEITKEPLSFATRPDSVHLVMFLNNYIRLIRYNGKLDQLLDYWWHTTAWEKDH
ncbi:MAG: ABC transporter substrate-binding protein [Ectothiorhodospiraceae bacterium]|jgi:polar amino acid transport system substrate-binding protein